MNFAGLALPIVIGLTLEFHRLPSLYWPGAGPSASPLAKDLGLARAFEIFVIGDFGLTASAAASGSKAPGPGVSSNLYGLFTPIVTLLRPDPNGLSA